MLKWLIKITGTQRIITWLANMLSTDGEPNTKLTCGAIGWLSFIILCFIKPNSAASSAGYTLAIVSTAMLGLGSLDYLNVVKYENIKNETMSDTKNSVSTTETNISDIVNTVGDKVKEIVKK